MVFRKPPNYKNEGRLDFGATRIGNATLTAAVLIVVGLTSILFFAMMSSTGNAANRGGPIDIHTSKSIRTTNTARTSCVAPLLVQGDMGSFEPIPISVVGPNSTCAVASATSPDSLPLANFKVTLNATKPLNLTIGFTYEGNGTAVLPPSLAGINLTASDGIPNTAAAEPVEIRQGLVNATSIAIPSGETTFNFQAEVPKSVAAGTYTFDFLILVSPTDAGGFQGVGVSYLVNLDAQ